MASVKVVHVYASYKWISCMDKDIPTDAVYLDLSKAFDTVPHKKLLHKLKGYCIGGDILNWITRSCSGESPVTSGVPQGPRTWNGILSPHTHKNIDFIENVQRHFSRCIVAVKDKSCFFL